MSLRIPLGFLALFLSLSELLGAQTEEKGDRELSPAARDVERKDGQVLPIRVPVAEPGHKVMATIIFPEQRIETLGDTLPGAGELVVLRRGTGAEKDKAEISTLKARAEEASRRSRPVTPIAVPLSPGLTATNLEDRSARVTFDADGTGRRKEWTWITRDAAWLVYDPKRMGRITSGLQLFGNVTFWMFWETGYDALAAFDDNHDGLELEGLALWQDLNGNGIRDAGEVKPVSEFGIVAISCMSKRDPAHPDRIAYSPTGVTFKDGTTLATFDLVLHSW